MEFKNTKLRMFWNNLERTSLDAEIPASQLGKPEAGVIFKWYILVIPRLDKSLLSPPMN